MRDERVRSGPPRNIHGLHAVVVLLVLIAAAWSASAAEKTVIARMEDIGPRVVLEPRPEADIVCLTVSVPTGSAYEAPDTRGMSHFLEHMVFDGTERWSRTEMSDWIDERGAFLNAFTRKEVAVYFLVVARDDLERGMELMSQMLLHSIFPPDEFEKERKIILEELRKGMDDPSSKRGRFVDRYLYRGSSLAEPIMGYASTVEAMCREEMMRFYRERYRTGLMRIHLVGGFDRTQAAGWIKDYFPRETPPGPPPERPYELNHMIPRWAGEVTVRDAGDLDPGMDILVRMPDARDRDFPAALLAANLLMGEHSPLPALFDSLSLPEPAVDFEVHRMFSALRIHVPWGDGGSYLNVPEILGSLGEWEPSEGEIEATRTALRSAELFDREKYHFYVMLHGEKIGLFGETYLNAALYEIQDVRADDCRRFIRSTFDRMLFNACLLRPETESAPPTTRQGGTVRTLENGCVITARAKKNWYVAALHLLVKGRNCLDQEAGREGMSALLHALFSSSADERRLSGRLESLGCRLQWQDNPYIPMDDYYLNPAYSFVRLEAPADKIEQAAVLLFDFLYHGALTGDDLARAMRPFGMELMVRGGSTSAALRGRVYGELMGGHPYGSPIFPAREGLESVTIEEVNAFRENYMRAGDMIVSLVSPMTEDEGLDMLEGLLSALPAGGSGGCPPLPDEASFGVVTDTIQKEGAYLAAGWLVREDDPDRLAALLVAAEVLSRRMQRELREKRGLTYSTGCSVTPLPGGAVAMATIGTRGRNLEEAEAGLRAEIERLSAAPPAPGEVEAARSRLLGSRARSELSSINEASTAGIDLFITGEETPMNTRIARVTSERVARAASLLSMEHALLVRLVPGGGKGEESVPPSMRMPMR